MRLKRDKLIEVVSIKRYFIVCLSLESGLTKLKLWV
jgi:hypothetical protein